MITSNEALELATQYNYEKIIREKAELGHLETILYFCSEKLAQDARKTLMDEPASFRCSLIKSQYNRDGTDYYFTVKWGRNG